MALFDLERAFVRQRVRVTRKDGTSHEGEYRAIWHDSVPYFPNIPTPALWVTNWGEYFTPLTDIESIETIEAA